MHLEQTSTQPMEGAVTVWINRLRRGESGATEGLWEAYFHRMRGLARRMIQGKARRTCDGDDAAASAFRSFYEGARAGEFPRVRGRHDLWPLLAAITSNKCVDRMRREGRLKRGGGANAAESACAADLHDSSAGPESDAELADLRDRYFAILDAVGDPTLRRIVEWRLAGEAVGTIARRLGCVRRTVERKLRLLQEIWESEMP